MGLGVASNVSSTQAKGRASNTRSIRSITRRQTVRSLVIQPSLKPNTCPKRVSNMSSTPEPVNHRVSSESPEQVAAPGAPTTAGRRTPVRERQPKCDPCQFDNV